MKYKISELSVMAGIAAQTLRRYEERGIITAYREEQNGYRYYRALDLAALIRVRMYRNYGFSLNEITELFSQEIDEDIITFENRIKDLEKETLVIQNLIKCAKRQINEMKDINNYIGSYHIVNLSPMIGILYRDKTMIYNTSKLKKTISNWAEKTPMVKQLLIVSKDSFLKMRDEYSVGLCITKEDALKCGIKMDEYCFNIPGGKYLHTVIKAKNELNLVSEGYIDKIKSYLHNNKMTISGDIIGSTIVAVNGSDGNITHYQNIYIPI